MTKSIVSRYDKLLEEASSTPLSQLLPSTLTLVRKLGNQRLEKWVRLELEGYFNTNSALTDDVIVPEYRTVAGYRSDEFGRPLILQDSRLGFINQDRLRNGVAELEHFVTSQKPITYRDPVINAMIRKEFGVEVTRFTFDPSGVSSVLSGIRAKLIDWLYEIEPEIDKLRSISTLQNASKIESSQWTKTDTPKNSRVWISQIRRMLIIVALIGLVVVIVSLAMKPESPSQPSPLQSFQYSVRVQAKETGQDIADAKVTIEIIGQAPLDEATDSNGFARIFIDANRAGQPGRLIVQATRYKKFTQNIDLLKDILPDMVQLEMASIGESIDDATQPSETTITEAPSTDTPVPLTNTSTPSPTNAPVPPTDTPVPPTNTSTPFPTNTPVPPTDTPVPINTPTPTFTATSTNTPEPTPTPYTQPESILEVGETWYKDGISIKLEKAELTPGESEGDIRFEFLIGNKTGHEILLTFSDKNFSLEDNFGNEWESRGFRNNYFSVSDDTILKLPSGYAFSTTEVESFYKETGLYFKGNLSNRDVVELIITANNISSIEKAQWRFKISR